MILNIHFLFHQPQMASMTSERKCIKYFTWCGIPKMIIFWLECHLIMKKCSSEMHQFESADPVFQAPSVILGRWWPGNLLRVFLQIIDQGYYKKYLLILYPWWAKDSHLQTINTSKITSCISIVIVTLQNVPESFLWEDSYFRAPVFSRDIFYTFLYD